MKLRIPVAFVLAAMLSQAVIVDRIAIVIGKRVIKDSDIMEDLRVSAFLNNEQPSFQAAARKKAADRLIDQETIRDAVEQGDYPMASIAETKSFLAGIKKPRFATESAYQKALAAYQINEDDLLERLTWQLTVLRFIDLRFRPAANPAQADLEQYYKDHRKELTAQHPGKTTFDQLQSVVQDAVVNQQIDKALDEWLKRKRMEANIVYYEEELK